jgi:hypothetical protein
MDQSIVPLMVRFRRPSARWEPDLQYDEAAQLNVSFCEGQVRPTILLPGSLANMKTLTKQAGGED